MEQLFEKYRRRAQAVSLDFQRSLMGEIDWQARLVAVRGARGVGKTTMLLQYLRQHHAHDDAVLYASLDDLWFSANRLVDLADSFAKFGGRYLVLDEVHKYPEWSREIKNIYDNYPELKIIFTGSSLLEILNARADLSRRALAYRMQGLSFREYLNMTQGTSFAIFTLPEILSSHQDISRLVLDKIRPLAYFSRYLQSGYYPFFKEGEASYNMRLQEVVNFIMEVELPLLRGIGREHVHKLKQLLLVLAESAPFTPNISKISERIGVARNTLLGYMQALQEAGLTAHLHRDSRGISRLQKPDKVFVENPNLAALLAMGNVDSGTLREGFFYNQIAYKHKVTTPKERGDFLVDDKWLFEIGGKSKTTRQIGNTENSYIAADNIEFGLGAKIPLWMFGFLY